MLANRCITQGANMFASDALLGLAANPEDESLAVWDPEDEEFVSDEEAARRERDMAPVASPPRPVGGVLKRTDGRPEPLPPEGEPPDEGLESAPDEPEGEAPAAPAPAPRWTRIAAERKAFANFLTEHGLTEDEAKAIAAERLGLEGPLALFSDWPYTRERLQHVILTWLLHNRPAEGAEHWIDNPRARGRFWATVGEAGYDEQAVHEIIPSLHAWPGTLDEAVDYVVNAEREDRTWLGWPAPEGQEPLL